MGRRINSGLATGIRGQVSIENYELDSKLKEQANDTLSSVSLVSESDYKILNDAKVKYNKADVIFVTHDSGGQLIWLEKGNEKTGLNHILARHANDFANKHGVAKNEIHSHINSIIKNGKLEYSKVTQRNGRNCYERLYSKSGKYYLQTGVGLNGYMVSAYPISEKEALALIRRNKK